MASKLATDDTIDGMLTYLAETAYKVYVVTTGAVTTYSNISSCDLTTGHTLTSADFSFAAGDTSGRKITIAEQSSLNVSTSGTAGGLAVVSSGNALMFVTTVTTQALTSGNTVTIPAWDIEINDPT